MDLKKDYDKCLKAKDYIINNEVKNYEYKK